MIFESNIEKIIPRTSSVKSFLIPRPKEFCFKAGQFMEVTIKVDGHDQTKCLTISSSPSEKEYIQFTKRITNNVFSQTLDHLTPGAMVKINGPLGYFTLDHAKGNKIAFLSGGIGITPIHSICQYALDKKIDRDIVLVYGNRNEEDIPFKDDLERFQSENPYFRMVYVLDNPLKGWNGYVGFITKDIIEQEIPDYMERTFFVCGPPKMVDIMAHMLNNDLLVQKEKVIIENFSGY